MGATSQAPVPCERCQLRVPERLASFGIGVRGGSAAWCAVCKPVGATEAEQAANRAEVIEMRKARLRPEQKYRCTLCGCFWLRRPDSWSLWDAAQRPCGVCDNSPQFLKAIEAVPFAATNPERQVQSCWCKECGGQPTMEPGDEAPRAESDAAPISDKAVKTTEETIDPVDAIQLLRTYLVHCRYVRRGLAKVATELTERAERHDDSKLFADEFAGFSRINKAARQHPYGSEEYRAGLRQEKPTIDLHYTRNSHHPEHHGHEMDSAVTLNVRVAAQDMSWLDIVEMVCDWRGAYLGYGSQGTWEENVGRQRYRYVNYFTKEQWWLIEQVARFVGQVGALPEGGR